MSGSRTRNVPLNREAREAFKAWREHSDTTGHVFENKTGGKFQNVRKAWLSVVRDAAIANFRWHDMRHHFASRLVMQGVPLNSVRELLGHADLNTTLRYAHLAPEHLKDAVELISR